jgi:uncharacterized Rossmann fold enzyme
MEVAAVMVVAAAMVGVAATAAAGAVPHMSVSDVDSHSTIFTCPLSAMVVVDEGGWGR